MTTMHPHTQQFPGVVLAEITGVTADGQPLVRTDGRRPRQALACTLAPAPDWRACIGKRAVLAFLDGDVDRPVLLGLVEGAATAAPATPPVPRTLRISLRMGF